MDANQYQELAETLRWADRKIPHSTASIDVSIKISDGLIEVNGVPFSSAYEALFRIACEIEGAASQSVLEKGIDEAAEYGVDNG